MRRAARKDDNQTRIVEELRSLGLSVAVTHMLGNGFPDICVGYRGRNWLFEIKDPDKPPSKRKLTSDEYDWHYSWKGQIDVIHNAAEALAYMDFYDFDIHKNEVMRAG